MKRNSKLISLLAVAFSSSCGNLSESTEQRQTRASLFTDSAEVLVRAPDQPPVPASLVGLRLALSVGPESMERSQNSNMDESIAGPKDVWSDWKALDSSDLIYPYSEMVFAGEAHADASGNYSVISRGQGRMTIQTASFGGGGGHSMELRFDAPFEGTAELKSSSRHSAYERRNLLFRLEPVVEDVPGRGPVLIHVGDGVELRLPD